MLRIFFIIFILFSFEVYANKLITGLLKGSSRGSNIQVWGYAGLKAFSENCLQGDQNSLLCHWGINPLLISIEMKKNLLRLNN